MRSKDGGTKTEGRGGGEYKKLDKGRWELKWGYIRRIDKAEGFFSISNLKTANQIVRILLVYHLSRVDEIGAFPVSAHNPTTETICP